METAAVSAATTTSNLSHQITKRNIVATVTLLVSSLLIIVGALLPIGQSIGTYNYILMGAGSLGLACFAFQLICHCSKKSKISNKSSNHYIIPTPVPQPSSSLATSSSSTLPNPSADNTISKELLNQLPSSLIEALGSELTTNHDVLFKCQLDNLADFYQKIISSEEHSVQITLRNDSFATLEKEGFSSQVITSLFKIFNYIPKYKNTKLMPFEIIMATPSKFHIKLNPKVKTSETIETYLNILGFYREEDSDSDEMLLQLNFGHRF